MSENTQLGLFIVVKDEAIKKLYKEIKSNDFNVEYVNLLLDIIAKSQVQYNWELAQSWQ